jgi:hypothetical protein
MNDDSLLSGASAETAEAKETNEAVPHLEKAPEPPKAAGDGGTEAWIASISGALYKDGKPNYEMLPEKFWKDGAPRVDEALKARSELEKQFKRGDHKTPENYDTSFLAAKGVTDDDPLVGSFKSWAKENGVSQAAFQKLAENYIELQMQQQSQVKINVEAEKQKLGPNADQVISEMVTWGQSMVKRGVWSQDDFDEFKIMGGTARGLNALMKVREFYGDMRRIPTDVASTSDRPSKDELQSMIGDPRYKSDPAFRRKVEKAFEEMYSE